MKIHDLSDAQVLEKLTEIYLILKATKPDDRSETARRYAVTITEYEKVIAYFKTFVVEGLL